MIKNQDLQKEKAAIAAIDYIKSGMTIGVGTGSTVNYFIDHLASIKHKIDAAVSSSKGSTERLKAIGIPVVALNDVSSLDLYVDGADEVNTHKQMIKGGGAALTGEKIVASVSKQFICIADESKKVDLLGKFPLPIEVIPLARSAVARELVKLGGFPNYREGVITDYGNVILDTVNLDLKDPLKMEETLNQIPGVVTNGIFAKNRADIVILGTDQDIKIY